MGGETCLLQGSAGLSQTSFSSMHQSSLQHVSMYAPNASSHRSKAGAGTHQPPTFSARLRYALYSDFWLNTSQPNAASFFSFFLYCTSACSAVSSLAVHAGSSTGSTSQARVDSSMHYDTPSLGFLQADGDLLGRRNGWADGRASRVPGKVQETLCIPPQCTLIHLRTCTCTRTPVGLRGVQAQPLKLLCLALLLLFIPVRMTIIK